MDEEQFPINSWVYHKRRNMVMEVVARSDEGGWWLYRRMGFSMKPFIIYETHHSRLEPEVDPHGTRAEDAAPCR